MNLSKEELKVIKVSLIMEWEMMQSISWTVDGVSIPNLVKKIKGLIEHLEGKEIK